jgi:hypothetical protein
MNNIILGNNRLLSYTYQYVVWNILLKDNHAFDDRRGSVIFIDFESFDNYVFWVRKRVIHPAHLKVVGTLEMKRKLFRHNSHFYVCANSSDYKYYRVLLSVCCVFTGRVFLMTL